MVFYLFLCWIKFIFKCEEFLFEYRVYLFFDKWNEYEFCDKNGLKSECVEFVISVICVELCVYSSKYVF